MVLLCVALATWLRYQQLKQDALRRSQEVGIDAVRLRQMRRQRSFLLRLSDRYDRSDHAERTRSQLAQANLDLKPSEYLAFRILGVILLVALNYFFLRVDMLIGIPAAILIGIYAPPLYLRTQHRRYLDAFDEQLIEAVSVMAGAIRAGMSVPQAIDRVSRKMPSPAGPEFRQLALEINVLGRSVEATLTNALRRLPSEDLAVVVSTLVIQRQSGGNLVKALTQLSDIMRERSELRKEINTMTAEVRYTAYIIIGMPVVVVLFLRNVVPELVNPLFQNPIGWVILTMFAAALTVAFILIKRVANIRV